MRNGRPARVSRVSIEEQHPRRRALVLSGVLLLFGFAVQAESNLNLNSPLQLFTNVAARFLRSEIGTDFARIQIYPTNQYTPALHRLLQVTANVYDATTNRTITGYPHLPSVFRPLFRKQGTNLFIAGYEEVAGIPSIPDPRLALPVEAKALAENPALPDGVIVASNVYNVPWIIGAKKGFPNFNEFSMQNAISVTRRLEFRRRFWQTGGDPYDPNNSVAFTNQLYSIGISNVFALEAWNSYSNAFPRFLLMGARGELEVVFYETNSANEEIILSSNVLASVIGINIPENSWSAGTTNLNGSIAYPTSSFLVPLQPAATLVETNFGFLQSTTGFDGVQGGFHNVSNTIPILRWWLRSRYRVRFLLLDASVSPMRVVDYVSLSRDEEPVDVTFKLAGNIPIGNYGDGSQHGGWYTNRLGDSQSESAPTAGILNQIGIGLGFIFPGSRWRANDAAIRAAGSIANAIEFFEYNLRDLLITPNPQIYKTNVFHAPYDPSLAIYQHLSLQANDPLVRLTLPDLIDPILNRVDFVSDNPALPDIRRVNVRYRPWGASSRGVRSGNASDFDRANKDARVFQSDDWQFPTNLPNDLTRFGQIHRGTPWQTIYLKSDDVNTNSDNAFWRGWTGYTDPADAALTRPVNDWRVASHLVSRLNTNDPHALLSPNVADTNAWLNALNGIIVITNSGIALPGRTLEFNEVVMTSNSPQAASIAGDINLSRISQPSQRFEYPGGVFATPALSCGSPWLNLDSLHLRFGATDEAYEMVPSQLLPMLRLDSIGSTIRSGNQLTVRFTGCDDYLYVVQVSSNLTDWISIHTNRPVDGILAHTDTLAPGSTRRFYRSLLVP